MKALKHTYLKTLKPQIWKNGNFKGGWYLKELVAGLSWKVPILLGPSTIHSAGVMVALGLLFCGCSRPSTGNGLSGLPAAMLPVLVATCLIVLVFFLKRLHRSSLTVISFVLGWYGRQTNFSMAATISSFGWAACPSSARVVIIDESASANIFQQRSFPFPEKLPVLSAQLRAWDAGSAAIFSGPRVWTVGFSSIIWWCCPLPVTNSVFSHDCR